VTPDQFCPVPPYWVPIAVPFHVAPVIAPAVEMSQVLVLTDPAYEPLPKVNVLLAVNAPLAVNPDVAVIRPDMVGVAVQEVGLIVNVLPAIVVPYEALPNVVAADIP
jgi:hypothetical protein